MKKEILEKILNDHKLWLNGKGGERANLGGAYLEHAYLRGANLGGANFEGAYLRGANLRGANLRDANLGGANLRGANLEHAYLERANFEGAYLDGANFGGAYLEGAYLEGAYLGGCAGNRRHIKSLFINELWPITYTSKHLQIGCKRFLISDWWEFNDEQISEMDGLALEFWREHKDFIKSAIERYPAQPTGGDAA